MGIRLRQGGVLAVALLVFASVVAAGCGGDDESAPSGAGTDSGSGELQEVDFLLSFPLSIYWTPIIVADEMGYFADEGLEMNFEEVDGSGFVTQQIIAGNFDFGSASAGDNLIAYSKDPSLRIFISPNSKNIYQFVVPEDSEIDSVEDLDGGTLGITEKGGGEGPIVDAGLRDAGLTPDEDVALLPIGSAGPQSRNAIESGQVDAYASSYPDISALTAAGLSLRDITPEKYAIVPGGGYLTREDVLADPEKRGSAVGIARAVTKGALFAETNPDAAYEIVCGVVPQECSDETAARAYVDAAIEFTGFSANGEGGTPYGVVPLEAWETAVGLLTSSGTIEGEVDVETFVADPVIQGIQDEYLDFDEDSVREQAEGYSGGS